MHRRGVGTLVGIAVGMVVGAMMSTVKGGGGGAAVYARHAALPAKQASVAQNNVTLAIATSTALWIGFSRSGCAAIISDRSDQAVDASGRRIAIILPQMLRIGGINLNDPLTHVSSKAGQLDPVDHHRQVGVLGSFNQDAPITILDLVELASLTWPIC